jgi:hypothetical protein
LTFRFLWRRGIVLELIYVSILAGRIAEPTIYLFAPRWYAAHARISRAILPSRALRHEHFTHPRLTYRRHSSFHVSLCPQPARRRQPPPAAPVRTAYRYRYLHVKISYPGRFPRCLIWCALSFHDSLASLLIDWYWFLDFLFA